MAKIKIPDANPMIAALLCLILDLGHVVVNKQSKKWLMILVAQIVGTFLCCLPGLLIFVLSLVDAYKTAEKLKAGKEIDENEYANPLLFKIIKIIHKDAVLVE